MKVYIVVEDEQLEEGGAAVVIQEVFESESRAESYAHNLNIPYGGYSVTTWEVSC
jgi:hypothetical protein